MWIKRLDGLSLCLAAYCLASFVHHVHNAEFLDAYPHMPAWLSRASVYLAWLGATALGVAGFVLFQRRQRIAGALLLAFYGFYGFDALVHYALAPMSAHTLAMNLTIWLEVAAAALLLAALARRLSAG